MGHPTGANARDAASTGGDDYSAASSDERLLLKHHKRPGRVSMPKIQSMAGTVGIPRRVNNAKPTELPLCEHRCCVKQHAQTPVKIKTASIARDDAIPGGGVSFDRLIGSREGTYCNTIGRRINGIIASGVFVDRASSFGCARGSTSAAEAVRAKGTVRAAPPRSRDSRARASHGRSSGASFRDDAKGTHGRKLGFFLWSQPTPSERKRRTMHPYGCCAQEENDRICWTRTRRVGYPLGVGRSPVIHAFINLNHMPSTGGYSPTEILTSRLGSRK